MFITKQPQLLKVLSLTHPFIDGNKRTGFLLGASFLLDYDIVLIASEDERYQFVIDISTGTLSCEEIVIWLRENTEWKKND